MISRTIFDRAVSAGNDLGLFSEEYETANNQLLGNSPQGLSHLSHVAAAAALAECGGPQPASWNRWAIDETPRTDLHARLLDRCAYAPKGLEEVLSEAPRAGVLKRCCGTL